MPALIKYPCKFCGADLRAMDWNDRCWIIVCKNTSCKKVHVPQETLVKESEEEAQLVLRHGLPDLAGILKKENKHVKIEKPLLQPERLKNVRIADGAIIKQVRVRAPKHKGDAADGVR